MGRSPQMGKGIRTAFILIMGIALGAFRDHLFVNLNYQIDHVQRGTIASYAHSRFQGFVEGWGLSDLLRMKWVLAIAFTSAMWVLCLLLLFNARRARLARPFTLLFVSIAAVAFSLHLIARWLPAMQEAAVNLLHAIQYPVLLIVVQVALWLFPSGEKGPR